jgi:hypothetical protein
VRPLAPLTMRTDWDPITYRRNCKIPPGAIKTTVPGLCRRAGIPVRATVDREIYVYRGRRKIRTPLYDLIGVPAGPRSREGALRALESLAYSFFDRFARYCVCGRGLFSVPVKRVRRRTRARHTRLY